MSQIEVKKTLFSTLKNKRKKWGIISLIILAVSFFVLNYGPVEQRPTHPFFQSNRPLVIAHQGGELLAPSNTMTAFKEAVDMGVDVIEFDIHISKDGELVSIHDSTVDRTTNGTGLVHELTLSELQTLDAGFHFIDLEGNLSYRGKGVYIPTVEEIFQTFPNMKMVIEIKDDNPPNRYNEIYERLWNLILEYEKEQEVIIASFDQDIVDQFKSVSENRVLTSAGEDEIRKFVLLNKFFLSNLYQPRADAFQLPLKASIFNLSHSSVINEAKRRNINIQFWTIDDPDIMRELVVKGVNGIITNRPDLLLDVLEEKGY